MVTQSSDAFKFPDGAAEVAATTTAAGGGTLGRIINHCPDMNCDAALLRLLLRLMGLGH